MPNKAILEIWENSVLIMAIPILILYIIWIPELFSVNLNNYLKVNDGWGQRDGTGVKTLALHLDNPISLPNHLQILPLSTASTVSNKHFQV